MWNHDAKQDTAVRRGVVRETRREHGKTEFTPGRTGDLRSGFIGRRAVLTASEAPVRFTHFSCVNIRSAGGHK